MQEIETEELRHIIENAGKFTIKIAVVVNDEFRINETVELLKEIETEMREAEFFIYCPNLYTQIKIDEPDPRQKSRAVAAGAVLHSMHLDTLPYSSVIVSVFRNEGDALRELCERAGAELEVIESL